MRIFICNELIKDISLNIAEMEKYSLNLNDMTYKPYFIYSFALFESALNNSMRHFLNAFPEKMNGDAMKDETGKIQKYFRIRKDTISKPWSRSGGICNVIVDEKIKSNSKGNLPNIVELAEKYFSIKINFNKSKLIKISDARNEMVHESRCSNKYAQDEKAQVLVYTNYCRELIMNLELISDAISTKYSKYTKAKLLHDSWDYLFDTPLLDYDRIVYFKQKDKSVCFYFDYLDTVINSISSSEKTFLTLLFQQYSGLINDNYFKFKDLSMLVSISDKEKFMFIIELFSKYPQLFNGEKIE